MNEMTEEQWRRVWAFYLAGALVSMGVLEWGAVKSRGLRGEQEGCTLTASSRYWLGIHPRKPYHPVGRAALILLSAWGVAHFNTGRLCVPGWGRLEHRYSQLSGGGSIEQSRVGTAGIDLSLSRTNRT